MMLLTAISLMWIAAVVSAVIDNIPFTVTMIPIIAGLEQQGVNVMPLWWALALGACLGGNGSLIGASANLIVAGFAERSGHRIRFLPFLLMAFPLMLLSIVIASAYLYLRYL